MRWKDSRRQILFRDKSRHPGLWKDLSEDLGVWIHWTSKDELNISCFGKNVDPRSYNYEPRDVINIFYRLS